MDRTRGRTIGWYDGDRSAESFKAFFERFKDIEASFYTDNWEIYPQIIPTDKHIIGKTTLKL